MLSIYLSKIRSAVIEITKAANEDEAYKYLAETLTRHFDFKRVTVGKVDWNRGRIYLVRSLGFAEEPSNFELPLYEWSGAFGEAALSGEPVAFETEESQSGLDSIDIASLAFHTAIVPVKVKDRVRAVFGVSEKTSSVGITAEDMKTLCFLAEIAGGALENVLEREQSFKSFGSVPVILSQRLKEGYRQAWDYTQNLKNEIVKSIDEKTAQLNLTTKRDLMVLLSLALVLSLIVLLPFTYTERTRSLSGRDLTPETDPLALLSEYIKLYPEYGGLEETVEAILIESEGAIDAASLLASLPEYRGFEETFKEMVFQRHTGYKNGKRVYASKPRFVRKRRSSHEPITLKRPAWRIAKKERERKAYLMNGKNRHLEKVLRAAFLLY